jgi:hypothetical protein
MRMATSQPAGFSRRPRSIVRPVTSGRRNRISHFPMPVPLSTYCHARTAFRSVQAFPVVENLASFYSGSSLWRFGVDCRTGEPNVKELKLPDDSTVGKLVHKAYVEQTSLGWNMNSLTAPFIEHKCGCSICLIWPGDCEMPMSMERTFRHSAWYAWLSASVPFAVFITLVSHFLFMKGIPFATRWKLYSPNLFTLGNAGSA